VLVAGATGYLGQHMVKAFHEAGYRVLALVRTPEKLIALDRWIDEIVFAEVTKPETLAGRMRGVDLVVSAVGITRQRDGLSYADVDYRANRNLLDEALLQGVERFAYVHVLNAEKMPNVAMARAKARFARELEEAPVASTVICPSGFYSDLAEILSMAKSGRVYLFGDGEARISPIDGSDLAHAALATIEEGGARIEIGGPKSFTHNEVARLAFDIVDRPERITHIPIGLAEATIRLAKFFGAENEVGAIEFFLAASRLDMTAPPYGSVSLAQFFSRAHDGGERGEDRRVTANP
jgi:uncharacterized protein YbjT (DUF2867 family)